MDIEHFGDGKDFAKRGFLDLLSEFVSSEFIAVPMLTSDVSRDDSGLRQYGKILKIPMKSIFASKFTQPGRQGYFEELSQFQFTKKSFAFIDPTIGVKLDDKVRSNLHIKISEIAGVLNHTEAVVVYDESYTRSGFQEKTDDMRTKLKRLRKLSPGISAFGYIGQCANFIVATKQKSTAKKLQKFRVILGHRVIE
jgi:hypothetical protein